jgi:FkbM family methyltransferase
VFQATGEREGVAVSGLTIGGNPDLHGGYLRALAAGRADPFMSRLFEESVPYGGAVVDGGAYLGYHSLIAARRVGSRGRVLALEPNPESYRALRANVRRNRYESRVIALPMGIGAWSGRRTFYFGDAGGVPEAGGLLAPERWTEPAQGRVLSLDSTVGRRAIDVIKLAIEGDTIDALRGMRRTLELSPAARLFIECNPAALARAGRSAAALLEELRDLGFRARVIEEIQAELAPAGTWLNEIAGRVQLLCEPASARRRFARRVRTARLDPASQASV